MHQETDTLGRPASPVLGGIIQCLLSAPGNQNSFLYQWMMSPTMQQDGKIRLLQAAVKATEKTISFFNAFCTAMDLTFQPGRNGGVGSNFIQIQISPQRIAVGAIVHDNNWPLPSHGSGETFASQRPARQAAQPITVPQPVTGAVVPAINKQASTGTRQPAPTAMKSNTSTCPESVRQALQREVNDRCKGDQSSCKGNDACPTLAAKMEEQQACMNARWKIMVKCYKGGDASHKEQLQNRINGLIRCQELFAKKCGPKEVPQPAPQLAPQPLPTNDPEFIKKMEELTGLTGAALIIYLVLSEGSRLFPPRNLIPIP